MAQTQSAGLSQTAQNLLQKAQAQSSGGSSSSHSSHFSTTSKSSSSGQTSGGSSSSHSSHFSSSTTGGSSGAAGSLSVGSDLLSHAMKVIKTETTHNVIPTNTVSHTISTSSSSTSSTSSVAENTILLINFIQILITILYTIIQESLNTEKI